MVVQNYLIIATAPGTVNGQTVTAGEVVNVALWDGVAPWTPPTGTETRADPTGEIQVGATVSV